MSNSRAIPLSTYAGQTEGCDMNYVHSRWAQWDTCANSNYGGSWVWIIIVFIIIVIIIWAIIAAAGPDFFQKKDRYGHKTKEVDHGRAIVCAIIVALIIVVILAFVARGSGY